MAQVYKIMVSCFAKPCVEEPKEHTLQLHGLFSVA